jgi:hypothetical protein
MDNSSVIIGKDKAIIIIFAHNAILLATDFTPISSSKSIEI